MARPVQVPAGIFDKNDYRNLVEARTILNNLVTTCDKSEACGLNVAVWRAQMADIDRQLTNIQMHFMTPPPTT